MNKKREEEGAAENLLTAYQVVDTGRWKVLPRLARREGEKRCKYIKKRGIKRSESRERWKGKTIGREANAEN